MREIKVYAPAKLNLYLDILDKRPDGYHNIETLFERIDLRDEIVIAEKGRGLKIKMEPPLDGDYKENLVYKAVEAVCNLVNIRFNLDIRIKKNIPLFSGLGGGSSDAASVLYGLNTMFELGIKRAQLFSIASDIGSDVMFFLLDKNFAIGRGTGEILKPIDTQLKFFHVIIKPKLGISTRDMYARVDRLLYRDHPRDGLRRIVEALEENNITRLRKSCYNIFEKVPGSYSSVIQNLKLLFKNAGTKGFLSGSGSAVFCIMANKKEAMDVLKKIPEGKDTKIFLTQTYGGGIYGDNRGEGFSKGGAE